MAPLEYTLRMTRPSGVQHEAGRLQERRAGVDERPRRIGDRGGVGAAADREPQAMPGDQVQRGGLVVHRQCHNRGVYLG
jgi:hypothetical protein